MTRPEIPFAGTVSRESAIEAFKDPGREALIEAAAQWGDAFTISPTERVSPALTPTMLERLKVAAGKLLENFGIKRVER